MLLSRLRRNLAEDIKANKDEDAYLSMCLLVAVVVLFYISCSEVLMYTLVAVVVSFYISCSEETKLHGSIYYRFLPENTLRLTRAPNKKGAVGSLISCAFILTAPLRVAGLSCRGFGSGVSGTLGTNHCYKTNKGEVVEATSNQQRVVLARP